jgi:hypothetical protein
LPCAAQRIFLNLNQSAGLRLFGKMLLECPVFFIIQVILEIRVKTDVSMKIMQSLLCVIGVWRF